MNGPKVEKMSNLQSKILKSRSSRFDSLFSPFVLSLHKSGYQEDRNIGGPIKLKLREGKQNWVG